MQSSSTSFSGEPDQSGPAVIADLTPPRAPGIAGTTTDVAALRILASRIDRPASAVELVGGDRLLFAARINLLARASDDAGDRLAQCLAPDYAMLVAPGQTGRMPGHLAQCLFILSFDGDVWERVAHSTARNAARLSGRLLNDRMAAAMIERIAIALNDAPVLADSLARGLLAHFADLARPQTMDRLAGGLTARQLTALRQAVEGELGHDWSVAILARIAGLSPFHFARAFKASMGIAPLSWIRLRRITVAQKLLRETRQPVTDIAAAMGYDSPSRFASAFRKIVGHSPRQFRAL